MAYIGREPQVGNFQVCDAISVVNGQAAYTMQVNSVNVSPETANHMLVSLNGVLQAPGSSYTVSGSTITFASNLVTGDVINFIHILGSVLDLGVPSDSTVSLAKLTATGTKDATTFLRGDNSFAVPSGGKIGQVVSTTLTAPFSTTNGKQGTGFTDVSGFSRTITPSATSSKIYIVCTIMCGTVSGARQFFQLIRGSTEICIGDAFSGGPDRMTASNFNNSSASESSSVCISFLDSPSSTSQQTYKIQTCNNGSDGNAVYINRQNNSGSGAGDDVTTSTITCMEVLA